MKNKIILFICFICCSCSTQYVTYTGDVILDRNTTYKNVSIKSISKESVYFIDDAGLGHLYTGNYLINNPRDTVILIQ